MKTIINELAQVQTSPKMSLVVSSQIGSFAEAKKLRLKLKNSINQAEKELLTTYEEDTVRKMINAAKSMAEKVNVDHLEKGIGIYVAPGFKKLVSLPFTVNEKVQVGSSFDVSDILYSIDRTIDYTVVIVSKQLVRLFEGSGNKLKEVQDANFPFQFEKMFQIQRTSPHSFYNNEESEIDQARVDNYYRKIEKLLWPYVKNQPVILLGTNQSLNNYKAVSKKKYHIITEFTGNFDKAKAHEISQLVEPELERFMDEKDKSRV